MKFDEMQKGFNEADGDPNKLADFLNSIAFANPSRLDIKAVQKAKTLSDKRNLALSVLKLTSWLEGKSSDTNLIKAKPRFNFSKRKS